MPCSQALYGIGHDCAPNLGGIRRIFMNLYSAVQVDVDPGSLQEIGSPVLRSIIGIQIKSGAQKFIEIVVPKGVASLASTLNSDPTSGNNFVANTLTIALNRMDTSKRMAVAAVAISEVIAIVEDNNGKFWLVGYDEPLTANGGDSGTGTAKTDRNGYGLTLVSEETTYPMEVARELISSSIIDADDVDKPTLTISGQNAVVLPADSLESVMENYDTAPAGVKLVARKKDVTNTWLDVISTPMTGDVTFVARSLNTGESSRSTVVIIESLSGNYDGKLEVTVTQPPQPVQ